MHFSGTSNDDFFTGTHHRDGFRLQQGGSDTALGGHARDRFYMGATLNAADRINGGSGNDRLYLNGDYTGANALVCDDNTFRKIGNIILSGGHSYDMTLADGNGGPRGGVVNAFLLGAGDTLHLDLSAETNGGYSVLGGGGDDVMVGSQAADILEPRVGNDSVDGSGGDDELVMGGPNLFGAGDHLDGGAGFDDLIVAGHYSGTLHISAAMLTHMEEIEFVDPLDYDVVIDDGVVGAGETLIVTGIHFGGSVKSLALDASGESDGVYHVTASDHADVINLGDGNDTIEGRGGGDDLTAGAGSDVFVLNAALDSTGVHHDVLHGVDFDGADRFDLPVTVEKIDPTVASGTLSDASFNSDLGHAINRTLHRDHAIVFTPDAGDLAGHTFLIVDANHTGRYEAGSDYVFDLDTPVNLASLDTGDFF